MLWFKIYSFLYSVLLNQLLLFARLPSMPLPGKLQRYLQEREQLWWNTYNRKGLRPKGAPLLLEPSEAKELLAIPSAPHKTAFEIGPNRIQAEAPIWLHAASGEVEYAKELLRILKRENPHTPILISYTSPSFHKFLPSIQDLVDWVSPLPFDRPAEIQAWLDLFQPQVGVFIRTDIWPTLVHLAHKKNIPLFLMAGAFNPGSKKNRGLGRWITKDLLKKFQLVFVNSSSSDRLDKTQSGDVLMGNRCLCPDPRWDQVFWRKENRGPLALKGRDAIEEKLQRQLIVAGSTWPEDEQVLLEAFIKLKKSFPGVKLLLAPHEIDHRDFANLKELAEQNKLQMLWFTSPDQNLHEMLLAADVVIFSPFGFLLDLYALGFVSFIGGSFKKQVHSVMEALCQGQMVVTGPFYENNFEAIEFKNKPLKGAGELKLGMLNCVENAEELFRLWSRVLRELEANPHLLRVMQQEILECCRGLTGGSRVVYEEIKRNLLLR